MTLEKEAGLIKELAKELEKDMLSLYGPTLFGKNLVTVLGFKTADAFRQSLNRQNLPVSVFSIEKRRGKYALTKDVALWLAKQRINNTEDKEVDN